MALVDDPGPSRRTRRSSTGPAARLVLAWLLALAIPGAPARAAVPDGIWLIDGQAAVQIFDCDAGLCGRIRWLQNGRDAQGRLDRDKNNPDPALRQRPLCGLTVFWGLRPDGADRWRDGWFYNPDDGETYRFSAEQSDAVRLTARIYRGIPLFGQTKTLVRVAHGTSEGWC